MRRLLALAAAAASLVVCAVLVLAPAVPAAKGGNLALAMVQFALPSPTIAAGLSITHPRPGAAVAAPSRVAIRAPGRPLAVFFYLDGRRPRVDRDAPFGLNRSGIARRLAAGRHRLTVVARYRRGRLLRKSFVFRVRAAQWRHSGDTTPPSVSWAAGLDGRVVSGLLSGCEVTASDGESGIDRVRFYADGAPLGTDRHAPYRCRLNTATLADGDHALIAVARDRAGNSASTSISVRVANEPPPEEPPPPPTASFAFSPATPDVGQIVIFDGTASGCPASPCSYAWDDVTVGVLPIGSGQTVQHAFGTAGTKQVRLTVTDSRRRVDTHTQPITVVAPPPPPPDSDGDGVADADDQCPSQAGPASDNGCPPTSPSSHTKYGFHQALGYFGDNGWWGPRLDATASIGSQVSRGTMLWSVVEPSDDTFSWTRYDALVAAIKAKNMVPVFDLGLSPSWANGSSDPWVIPSSQTAYDTWVAEYGEFAARVAARYAGQGVLYEIWNEPNEQYFWKGSAPSIDRYAQLFTAARRAMLSADPTAKVGLGGITGLGAGCCISGRDFISGLIDRGVQFEYAGIHPYVSALNRGPDTHVAYQQNFDDILMIHNLLESRGRANVKLWATEWGWYGCSPDDPTKAAWLRRAHERIRDEWSSFVTISAYFMDSDQPEYPCAGALKSDLTRKPLADAFEQFMTTVP